VSIDKVLQEVAVVMRSVVRDVDTIYRYGGEEFLILMPETECAAGLELCDRLREAVTTRVTLPNGQRPTLSGGVAAFPTHADNPSRLVSAADEALYDAKSAGRDRVVAAQTSSVGVTDPPACCRGPHSGVGRERTEGRERLLGLELSPGHEKRNPATIPAWAPCYRVCTISVSQSVIGRVICSVSVLQRQTHARSRARHAEISRHTVDRRLVRLTGVLGKKRVHPRQPKSS
jgi:hypothetical protein